MSHPYAEHRAHKHEKSRVHHIAGHYAAGGAVGSDTQEDRSEGRKVTMKPDLMKMAGGAVKHRADKRARGGGVKKKSHKGTNVNILIGHGGATPPPPMAGPPPTPPMLPAARPPMPMPAGVMPPGMPAGAPPAMLPHPGAMPIRRAGGRAYATGGRVADGPAWREGLRNGTQPQNSPGKSDDGDIGRPRQRTATTYAKGGRVEASNSVEPATKLPGGSGGGEARLAKEKRARKNYKAA